MIRIISFLLFIAAFSTDQYQNFEHMYAVENKITSLVIMGFIIGLGMQFIFPAMSLIKEHKRFADYMIMFFGVVAFTCAFLFTNDVSLMRVSDAALTKAHNVKSENLNGDIARKAYANADKAYKAAEKEAINEANSNNRCAPNCKGPNYKKAVMKMNAADADRKKYMEEIKKAGVKKEYTKGGLTMVGMSKDVYAVVKVALPVIALSLLQVIFSYVAFRANPKLKPTITFENMPRHLQVKLFRDEYKDKNGKFPTLEIVARQFDISPATVSRDINK